MNLKHINDKILLADTSSLAKTERETLSKILWHLHEIDRRKLYADIRCSSLFDYCVKVLKYSEGQASRRVKACRMLSALPELAAPIEEGTLNLTQLGMVAQHFADEKIVETSVKKDIIELIKGKSTRDTDDILRRQKQIETPRTVKITIQQNTLDELNTVKNLKAHSCKDMDSLLTKMSQEVMKLWDPTFVKRKAKESLGESRYVSVQTRGDVWKRDEGKCSNCGSTYALEIDHILPYSRGGKTLAPNLKLLCRSCNLRKGDGSSGTWSKAF